MNNDNGINKEKYNKVFLYLGLAGVFVIGIIVASLRTGESYDMNSILVSLYAQQTVTDVVYVYLCGVDYYLSHGADFSVLGNALFGLFPGSFYGVSSSYNFTKFLIDNYAFNPGGGLFFTEGVIAFGPVGVILYLTFLASIIRKLFKKHTSIANLMFILIFVMFCRIFWYGMIYTYKPILLTIAIFLILTNIKQSKKVN